MQEKASYEELQQRVKELEKKVYHYEHHKARRRENEERLWRLIEYSPECFFVHDFEGNIIDVNKPACESLGYTREELLRMNVRDIDEAFTAKKHWNVWRRMIPGVPAKLEGIRRRKDNTTFPVEISLSVFDTGKGKYMLGITRDVTEKKMGEAALRESEEKYRMLFEHGGFSTCVSDLMSGKFVAFNKKAYEALGYTREEFENLSLIDINVDRSREEILQIRKQIIDNGPRVIEVKHRTKDGEVRNVLVSSVPVRIQGKSYVQSIYLDITDRKRMEEELTKSKLELEIKNKNLEEMNAALHVLLKKREKDKVALEEKVLLNMKELVIPYIEKLNNNSGLDEKYRAYLDIIDSNLRDIISSFAHGLSSIKYNLTPMEIQIADLIKQGKTTKEIAELFNLSYFTINAHRRNIRKKLAIKNKKANLKSLLMSFH